MCAKAVVIVTKPPKARATTKGFSVKRAGASEVGATANSGNSSDGRASDKNNLRSPARRGNEKKGEGTWTELAAWSRSGAKSTRKRKSMRPPERWEKRGGKESLRQEGTPWAGMCVRHGGRTACDKNRR